MRYTRPVSVTGFARGRAPCVVRLRARRGAIAAMMAILLVSMIAVGALTVDMSRIENVRSDLQDAADAGALAGAQYLIDGSHVWLSALDTARDVAQKNLIMGSMVTIDSLELGICSGPSGCGIGGSNFSPGATPPNAVHIVTSRQSNALFLPVIGVSLPPFKARAIARFETFAHSTPGTVDCSATDCAVLVK